MVGGGGVEHEENALEEKMSVESESDYVVLGIDDRVCTC